MKRMSRIRILTSMTRKYGRGTSNGHRSPYLPYKKTYVYQYQNGIVHQIFLGNPNFG